MPSDLSVRFPETRGSAIASVASEDPAARARAFDVIVRAYWKPVYAHLRLRWRRPPEDARDLVQGFFARAFEKRHLAGYDPTRARFRTYLRGALDNFVAEEARRAARDKRGGGLERLSLDFEVAEEELARNGPRDPSRLETCFDEEWTRRRFEASLAALERTCREAGKEVHLEIFRRYVLAPGLDDPEERPTYAALATELGVAVTDVTNHLSWARRTFRECVVEELRAITATEEELREEASALLGRAP